MNITPKKHEVTLDGASHGSILEKPGKDKLLLDLATAGNKNREAKNRNEKKGRPCSVDFGKDAENGTVRISHSYDDRAAQWTATH